jgi:hypothetical protein
MSLLISSMTITDPEVERIVRLEGEGKRGGYQQVINQLLIAHVHGGNVALKAQIVTLEEEIERLHALIERLVLGGRSPVAPPAPDTPEEKWGWND